jgi:hypothetical protein
MFFISETEYRIHFHETKSSQRWFCDDCSQDQNLPVISTITSFEKDYRDFPKFIRNVTKINPQLVGSPRELPWNSKKQIIPGSWTDHRSRSGTGSGRAGAAVTGRSKKRISNNTGYIWLIRMRTIRARVQNMSGRMANGFGYTPGISKNMNTRGFVVMVKKKSDTMTKINPRVNGLRSSWYVLIYIYSNGSTRIIFSVDSITLTGKNGPAQFFIGNNSPPLPK